MINSLTSTCTYAHAHTCMYVHYILFAIDCIFFVHRDCIRSRDAHCVWDTSIDGGKCVYNTLTAGADGEGTVPSQ